MVVSNFLGSAFVNAIIFFFLFLGIRQVTG